jgi:uncharacterized protein RhaS with RHS repeats
MQARYYDPAIGRFLSIDPVGFSVGSPEMFGRYTYVGNDPVNGVDPDGENLKALKFVYKGVKYKGNFKKAGVETLKEVVTLIGIIKSTDSDISFSDKIDAGVELVTGIPAPTLPPEYMEEQFGEGLLKSEALETPDSIQEGVEDTVTFAKRNKQAKNAEKNAQQKKKTQRGPNNQLGDDEEDNKAKEKQRGERKSRQSKD